MSLTERWEGLSPGLRRGLVLGGATVALIGLASLLVNAPKDERTAIPAGSILRGVLLSGKATARLIDVVDLNANNFLVVHENEFDVVRVVDFEMQSTAYAPRNRIHVARILTTLKQRPWYALMLLLQGWTGVLQGLLRWQFAPYAERVFNRQPSLASLLVAEVRTVTGMILGRLLRLVGLD